MPDLNTGSLGKPKPQARRSAFVLPSLFTAGNIFLGFLAILHTVQGAMAYASRSQQGAADFAYAAKIIGISVLLDGLDGRVARMTNTTSAFGAELDSLADVISFGIAPAILAFFWGVQFLDLGSSALISDHLQRAGKFIAFLFLLCGAARLARFNVQKNPQPKNPGRPHRKYFVGLPIPSAAGMIAAVVYYCDGFPIGIWFLSVLWLLLTAVVGLLMVSTWRYYSFKDLNLLHPRSPLTVILLGVLIFMIWFYSQPVLLILASTYVMSGIFTRVGGLLRRVRPANAPQPEHQLG